MDGRRIAVVFLDTHDLRARLRDDLVSIHSLERLVRITGGGARPVGQRLLASHFREDPPELHM